MPFSPRHLPSALIEDLQRFLQENDFALLYRSYHWNNDSFAAGFPDICKLETDIRAATIRSELNLSNVIAVAKWGRLRNIQRVSVPQGKMRLDLYRDDGNPALGLKEDPTLPLVDLQCQVEGLGPTYMSKILRFALPQEYGAIDTRIVRLVGQGDNATKQHDWLQLRARNDGYGWYIPERQSEWPREYGTWVNILRLFANTLNETAGRLACPHPPQLAQTGLRSEGIWTCADVEMALFGYVSQFT